MFCYYLHQNKQSSNFVKAVRILKSWMTNPYIWNFTPPNHVIQTLKKKKNRAIFFKTTPLFTAKLNFLLFFWPTVWTKKVFLRRGLGHLLVPLIHWPSLLQIGPFQGLPGWRGGRSNIPVQPTSTKAKDTLCPVTSHWCITKYPSSSESFLCQKH